MCHHRSFITPSAHHRIKVMRQCLSWTSGRLHKCAPKCYNNEASMAPLRLSPCAPSQVVRCACVCVRANSDRALSTDCMMLVGGFQQRMPVFWASCLGLAPTDEVIAQHRHAVDVSGPVRDLPAKHLIGADRPLYGWTVGKRAGRQLGLDSSWTRSLCQLR